MRYMPSGIEQPAAYEFDKTAYPQNAHTEAPYRHTRKIFDTIFKPMGEHFNALNPHPSEGRLPLVPRVHRKEDHNKRITTYTIAGADSADLAKNEILRLTIKKDGSVNLARFQELRSRDVLTRKEHASLAKVEEMDASPSGGRNDDFKNLCYTLCTALQRMYDSNLKVVEGTGGDIRLDRGAIIRQFVFGQDPAGEYSKLGRRQRKGMSQNNSCVIAK